MAHAPASPTPVHRPARTTKALSLLLSFFFPASLLVFFLLLVLLATCNGFLCLTAAGPPLPSAAAAAAAAARYQMREVMPRSPLLAVKEEEPPRLPELHSLQKLRLLEQPSDGHSPSNSTSPHSPPRYRWDARTLPRFLHSNARSRRFSARADVFFRGSPPNSFGHSCKRRFFMTWISTLESFGGRELFTAESLFKSHPDACLLILSNTMDSAGGARMLRPFLERGFRVSALSPDYAYLFGGTPAEPWFQRLRRGAVDPGEVPLGQNLSNLLRLAALYKFGGVYVDTDVIVMKSFSGLKNAIGAQTVDLETGNWSRLNNAVMVFDKKHPLLYKFIEEFALTFDGNKWGHNGPYLVSRVVARVTGRPGFRFSVLPPSAFYPVDWSRIRGLFRGPGNGSHLKWVSAKLQRIQEESYAIHLWNSQSGRIQAEEGSVIGQLISDCCVFCNSSVSSL